MKSDSYSNAIHVEGKAMAEIAESTGKVIINFLPVDRNLTITITEFKTLLGYYAYGNPHRLCFAIMGACGLRGVEVCDLKLDSFTKPDCSEMKYVIAKVKPRYTDKGTKIYNCKIRTVQIPEWLAKEILWYISNNYHSFYERRLFQYDSRTLRRYLGDLRERARNKKITNPLLVKMLLDSSIDRIVIGVKAHTNMYRFTLHSLRRMYLTLKYNVDFGKDLVRTQRDIGHELKETTMRYLHNPEMIGLTDKLISSKIGFDSLFDREQKNLNDYN